MSQDVLDNLDLEMVDRFLSQSIEVVMRERERGTPVIQLALLLSALSAAVAYEEPLSPRHILTQLADDLLAPADEAPS